MDVWKTIWNFYTFASANQRVEMYSFLALSHRQRKSGILTRKKEPRYLVLKLDSGASLLILIIFKFRGLNNAFKNQSMWFCCKKILRFGCFKMYVSDCFLRWIKLIISQIDCKLNTCGSFENNFNYLHRFGNLQRCKFLPSTFLFFLSSSAKSVYLDYFVKNELLLIKLITY